MSDCACEACERLRLRRKKDQAGCELLELAMEADRGAADTQSGFDAWRCRLAVSASRYAAAHRELLAFNKRIGADSVPQETVR